MLPSGTKLAWGRSVFDFGANPTERGAGLAGLGV